MILIIQESASISACFNHMVFLHPLSFLNQLAILNDDPARHLVACHCSLVTHSIPSDAVIFPACWYSARHREPRNIRPPILISSMTAHMLRSAGHKLYYRLVGVRVRTTPISRFRIAEARDGIPLDACMAAIRSTISSYLLKLDHHHHLHLRQQPLSSQVPRYMGIIFQV